MADRALLRRRDDRPLVGLRLNLSHYFAYAERAVPFLSSLLVKARSLGVRHLTIEHFSHVPPLLPTVFSTPTLLSLSLSLPSSYHFSSSTQITLTRLKRLSLDITHHDLNPLLSQLPSLEDLRLSVTERMDALHLSSHTIKTLDLVIYSYHRNINLLRLSLPSLELLHLHIIGELAKPYLQGEGERELPLLRKAVITLRHLHQKDVAAVAGLLTRISHAQDLSLHMRESWGEKHPFHILLHPGRDAPNFPNLKHLNVTCCFHRHNFGAVLRMLHHSPALESLKLLHQTADSYTCRGKKRKMEDWASKLPCNADGNYGYAYFINLHLEENSKEYVKWLHKNTSKRLLPCN